ncbi:hypothetical protein GGH93_004614 [Coemansia aciculifera]|nr:hypothetical protein GGH93_004614 [Coemansia aciculifera]
MKLFSAATILLANVVTASVAAQTGKDAIDIIEIYRLKIMEISDALTAIRAAQEAAIKSQREANENMEKVIKAIGDEVTRQQSVAQK